MSNHNKLDKKKRHQHGFSEDSADRRVARVGFKNYLRQIKEEEMMEEIEFDTSQDMQRTATQD